MMWLGELRMVSGSQCLQTALLPSTALWPSAGRMTPADDPGLLNLKHNSGRVILPKGCFLIQKYLFLLYLLLQYYLSFYGKCKMRVLSFIFRRPGCCHSFRNLDLICGRKSDLAINSSNWKYDSPPSSLSLQEELQILLAVCLQF